MPLNSETKNLFFSLPNTPFVGLIHKETKHIVLAPCIPQKVRLTLNQEDKVSSGTFIDDNFQATRAINDEELNNIRLLLEKNYVPRIIQTPSGWDEKSSHECLFEQQCQSTRRSEWGGFGITLDALGTLNYTFVSGAFNSLSNKREKGALLSSELITHVKNQTQELGSDAESHEIHEEPAPPISYDSPPEPARKRSRYSLFASVNEVDTLSSATHHENPGVAIHNTF